MLESRLSALRAQDAERKLLLEEERRRLWDAIDIEARERAEDARRITRFGLFLASIHFEVLQSLICVVNMVG